MVLHSFICWRNVYYYLFKKSTLGNTAHQLTIIHLLQYKWMKNDIIQHSKRAPEIKIRRYLKQASLAIWLVHTSCITQRVWRWNSCWFDKRACFPSANHDFTRYYHPRGRGGTGKSGIACKCGINRGQSVDIVEKYLGKRES